MKKSLRFLKLSNFVLIFFAIMLGSFFPPSFGYTDESLSSSTVDLKVKVENSSVEERWNAKFQATYVWQEKPSLAAAYSGANSLLSKEEQAYSVTSTAYFGLRGWHGAEFYINPEMIAEESFSNLRGLAGLTNSEQQKTSGPVPTFYWARAYLRQTFELGGEKNPLESGPNQLAGVVDGRRIVLTIGRLSIIDLFDSNAYAHDARSEFTNWTFLTHGFFDYYGDIRSYSMGAAIEIYYDEWALRMGRFAGPTVANGPDLDSDLLHHFGDQFEIEHSHRILNQPGKVRLMLFHNTAVMGGFADAITYTNVNNSGVPDVATVRYLQNKIGYGIDLEQTICDGVNSFLRAGWADGNTETYAFAEIDSALSLGVQVQGFLWGKPLDSLGLAVAADSLSNAHRQYLALGGMGIFIGDGQLNYSPERILETYYNFHLYKSSWLGFGYQHIDNPGYNADRGPVIIGMVRAHVEF